MGSFVRYNIYLTTDNIRGIDPNLLLTTLATVPGYGKGKSLADLERAVQEDLLVCWWVKLHYPTMRSIENHFKAIRCPLEIYEIKHPHLFPISLPNFEQEWYSLALIDLQEPMLTQWAQEQRINEAYRLLRLPSRGGGYVAYRLTTQQFFFKETLSLFQDVLVADDVWTPPEKDWLAWQQLIRLHKFWMINRHKLFELWGHDGTTYILEGIRNGKYKMVYDWSPEFGPMYSWVKFLYTIRPTEYYRRYPMLPPRHL